MLDEALKKAGVERTGLDHIEALDDQPDYVEARFELMMEDAQATASRNGLVEHRPSGHLLDVLPEVADGDLLRDRYLTLVGRFLARDHAEQRRLAGTIRPDQPDLLTRIQLKGCVDEQNLSAVLLAHTRQRDHTSNSP